MSALQTDFLRRGQRYSCAIRLFAPGIGLLLFFLMQTGFANPYVPGQFLVRFGTTTSLSQASILIDDATYHVKRKIDNLYDIFIVEIKDSELSVDSACIDILKYNDIVASSPDDYISLNRDPTDPYYTNGNQYNLNGTWGIRAPDAWDVTTGGPTLYGRTYDNAVAIIDATPLPTFTDLQDNLWHNLDENADGIDNDANGYIDDLFAANVRDGNNTVPAPGNQSSHGNSVCGAAGALSNNGQDVASVSWRQSVMMLDAGSPASISSVVEGLNYVQNAADRWWDSRYLMDRNGTNVVSVNISWSHFTGDDCDDPPTHFCNHPMGNWADRFTNLAAHGVIIVSGPSNCAHDLNTYADPPHTCDPEAPYHLVVNTSKLNGDRRWASSYGSPVVDLSAPAENIPLLSNDPNSPVTFNTGTSFASPQVAGAVALLHSVPNPSFQEYYYKNPRPGADAICDMIRSTARPLLGPPEHATLTNGVLDVGAAVRTICDYYTDNGHDIFVADAQSASAPSGTANHCRDEWHVAGGSMIYSDNGNIIYCLNRPGSPVRYYLLSPPGGLTDDSPGTGRAPNIALGRNDLGQSLTYTTWIADGPDYDSIKVLGHKAGGNGDGFTGQEWRMARLSSPVPWAAGTGAQLTGPIVVSGHHNIPAVVVGASGGSAPGVYVWRAPSMEWCDTEPWISSAIPMDAVENVTSVAADRLHDNSENSPATQLYVAWSSSEGGIEFIRGTEVGEGFLWPDDTRFTVSEGLSGVGDLSGVTLCYAPDLFEINPLFSIIVAWEGTDLVSGRRDIWFRKGGMFGGAWQWSPIERLPGSHPCLNRRAPHVQPFTHTEAETTPLGICPVGLVYERQYMDEPEPTIECRGLGIGWADWEWGDPITRLVGHNPSITQGARGANSPNFYLISFAGSLDGGPNRMFLQSLLLDYPTASPPNVGILDPDTITQAVRLHAPLNLDRSLVIGNGGNVTLDWSGVLCNDDPDPVITSLRRNIEIVIQSGGTLNVEGKDGSPIVFRAYSPDSTWMGIKVNGGQLTMRYAEMYDCADYCVYADKPGGATTTPIVIEDCVFDGSSLNGDGDAVLRLYNSPLKTLSVKNSAIQNVANGTGLDLFNSYVTFDGVTVQGCQYANSFISQVSGYFKNSNFLDRGTKHGVFFNGAGTIPNFQCCSFTDLAPSSGTYRASLWATSGTAPTFGYEGATGGVSNTIVDTSPALLRMYGKGILPVIDNVSGSGAGGKNDWDQNQSGGYFIDWQGPYPSPMKVYSARQQYWNNCGDKTPKNNYFYPTSSGYFDYSSYQSSPWGLCGGGGLSLRDPNGRGGSSVGLDDPPTAYDSLFMIGVFEEGDENFDVAQELFRQVALEATDQILRWQAMTHSVSTQRHLDPDAGESWIPGLLNDLVEMDSSAYYNVIYGNRLLASYRKDRGEFDTAIDILVNLLGGELESSDSLLVAIELVGVQMAAGTIEPGGGGLDSDNRIPSELRIASVEEGRRLMQQLLDSGFAGGGNEFSAPIIPTSYQLYQNYPNPFNPVTEIRFDLPKKTSVEINVFNTLGQLVATLLNEERPAGSYTVSWNASTTSSGMYIYQLKAGDFVDAKKMLLIR